MADDIERAELLGAWRDTIEAADLAERLAAAAIEAAQQALLARERAPESQRMADQGRQAEVDAGEAYRRTEA